MFATVSNRRYFEKAFQTIHLIGGDCMICVDIFQARTKHLYTICTTLAQRFRRWSNSVQM